MDEPDRQDNAALTAKRSEETDYEVPNNGSEAATDLRLRRIMDYRQEVLAKADALEANLGAVNSELMSIGYRLHQAIEAAMEVAPGALDDFQKLMPAIDNYLRIAKQIDRFAQLDLRLVKARERSRAMTEKLASAAS